MQCPFCQDEVGSEHELQLHCLVCPSAYAESVSTPIVPRVDSVVVRFRWVKSRPCFEREVHLISSLAGSVTLHRKIEEVLYESDTVGVPVGQHMCQLAIGGDVVATEPFEVNEESDVIFIILQEDDYRGYMMFGDNDRRARISTDDVGSHRHEPEPVDRHYRPQRPLDVEAREPREHQTDTSNEMSPLYRELLQHQLSHGEPSWVPGSGVQSPVMSEVDFSDLAGQQDGDEPPSLTPQPDSMEEQPSSPVPLQPGHEAESQPGDLSGGSDGVPSLPDGREVEEQDRSDNEAEEVHSSSRPPAPPSSSSPVPSSHSEHESRVSSRNSPVNSVPSEAGARDDSVISPLVDENLRHDSPPPITGSPLTEGEHANVVPPHTSPRTTPGREHSLTDETAHVPSAVQTPAEGFLVDHAHSSSRASPLGSVLETVTVPVTDTNAPTSTALQSDHEATTPPQRHSPAGSVHSSSLFSSGLPTPIMSPRGRSQSDTGMPLASRGSPLGSIHVQTQLPLRPQSLGGSVNLTEMVPISANLLRALNPSSQLESSREPISGAETSQPPPTLRQSPAGSNHSTGVHPERAFGMADDASRHSSQRSTPPVLSARSGSGGEASPFVAPPRTLPWSRPESGNSTPSVHSPRNRTSGAGSPTELLMEVIYRPGTEAAAAPSLTGSAEAAPLGMPSASSRAGHRESENSTPVVESPRHRSSGARSPSELLAETNYTTPVVARDGATPATPPVMSSRSSRTGHRASENGTPVLDSPRNRTPRTGSPSELLAETTYRQGTPPVVSHHGSTPATPPVLPSASPRGSHRGSENSTPSVHSTGHRRSGARSPSELLAEIVYRRSTPPVSAHGGHSRGSSRQSPASSVHSRPKHSSPRVVSPPLPRESAIPSHGSAFATVNGERGPSEVGLALEIEAVRQERDSLARDIRQRTAHFEAELRKVNSRNQDLEQQILSIETVANLTKRDDEKTQELEQTVENLNRALREKDEEISSLQESVRTLERTNQQLKEEQESLKTVNQLQLEDINKVNTDLQQELSDMRRSLDSSKTRRGKNEGKIIELQVFINTLDQHVKQLEEENTDLQAKLKKAKQEIDAVKAITGWSGSRLGKAKSETDLTKKFDKYTTYDRHRYRDPEPSKAVSFATRSDTSGLGTTRFGSWDTNHTRSHEVGVSSPVIMNGYGSPRSEAKRLASSYTSLRDTLAREPYASRATVPRHRIGSLGEDSDVSDDLDHGVGYHTGTQPRWLTQSSDSSTSSVVSWDHDYSTDESRQPRASGYNSSSLLYRDDRASGRRRRPHSYHGASGTLDDVYSSKDESTSSPYSRSLHISGQRSAASSSYSTNPQLLATNPHPPSASGSRTKLFSKPFAPTSSSDVRLGMEVLVTRSRGQIGRGVVKYVGPIPGRKDMYIGVELGPGQEGKHDGSLNGQRLFSCKPNQGIFVSFNKVVMCYG